MAATGGEAGSPARSEAGMKHLALAESLAAAGQLDDAIAAYWRVIEQFPAQAPPHSGLALALRRAGRPSEALACYRRAAVLAPNDARTQAALAEYLQLLGETASARIAYERAILLCPEDADATLGLAECLLELGGPEAAFAACDRALGLGSSGAARQRATRVLELSHPFVERKALAAAEALHAGRDWPVAIPAWEAVLRLTPGNSLATLRLITALRVSGRVEEAERLSSSSLGLATEQPGILGEHAWNANARHAWAEALARWDAADAALPNSWYFKLGRAEALFCLGRIDEADAVYRAALAREPASPALLKGHAACAVRRRDWRSAARALEALVAIYPGDRRIKESYEAARRALESEQERLEEPAGVETG